jgi:hypothetical protein
VLLEPAATVYLSFARVVAEGFTLADIKIQSPLLGNAPRLLVEANPAEPLAVVVGVPALTSANGVSFAYDLQAVLARGEERQTVECRLELPTRETLVNSENTIARLRAATAAAAAGAGANGTAEAPSPTPTNTPYPTLPTATPFVSATRTPVSTAAPPRQVATPAPPAALTPVPPKAITPRPPSPVTPVRR